MYMKRPEEANSGTEGLLWLPWAVGGGRLWMVQGFSGGDGELIGCEADNGDG